jgi:RepB DNA-primase from phage plasmid
LSRIYWPNFPSWKRPRGAGHSRVAMVEFEADDALAAAIEASLYDVGVLSDRGMLPGLDSISAAAVLERLPLLKYRNAHGSHIYIRPSGEHRFTTLDDLSETLLARLSTDGFNPCAVVETSAGNFQAWLKHSRMFPKLLGTFAAQTLAERYDADPSAMSFVQQTHRRSNPRKVPVR